MEFKVLFSLMALLIVATEAVLHSKTDPLSTLKETKQEFIADAISVASDLKESVQLKKSAITGAVKAIGKAKFGVIRGIKDAKIGLVKSIAAAKLAKIAAVKAKKAAIVKKLVSAKVAPLVVKKVKFGNFVAQPVHSYGLVEKPTFLAPSAHGSLMAVLSGAVSKVHQISNAKKAKLQAVFSKVGGTPVAVYPQPSQNPVINIHTYNPAPVIVGYQKPPCRSPTQPSVADFQAPIQAPVADFEAPVAPAAVYGPPATSYGVPVASYDRHHF